MQMPVGEVLVHEGTVAGVFVERLPGMPEGADTVAGVAAGRYDDELAMERGDVAQGHVDASVDPVEDRGRGDMGRGRSVNVWD